MCKPGRHTFQEILDEAGFDLDQVGGDYRRVKVSGLGFDSQSHTCLVPDTADEIVITLDGQEAARLEVGDGSSLAGGTE